jgi:glycosyltransferase involved in cell wall biosynthesis
VVFSSTPPHSSQFGVRLARAFRRFRWIADFRDPWTAPPRRPRGRFDLSLQRAMERSVLGRCDHVIANTPGNRDALLSAFPALGESRLSVVTNAFDDGDPVVPAGDVGAVLDCDIAYFGELYPGMLDVYLAAVAELVKGGKRVPRLHVFGMVDDDDVARVHAAGLGDRIVFRGTVPYARSISLMRASRSLLLLLPDMPRWATCVPSKLYAYLFAGPPILAITPAGDTARIVAETGRGVTVLPDDAGVVADALDRFVTELDAGGFSTPAETVRLDPYRMETIAGRIDEILNGGG